MIQYIILGLLSVLILVQPYLGIVVTLASLPLTDVLPGIGWASSILVPIGAVTVGSFILYQARQNQTRQKKTSNEPAQKNNGYTGSVVLGALLLLWMIVSSPASALIADSSGRVWASTFLQLWVLMALAIALLDNVKKINTLIKVYFAACVLSAAYAVMAQGNVGTELSMAERMSGLAGGVNTAARYFLFAMIIGLFLYQEQKRGIFRLLLAGAIIVLAMGLVFTVSRTGLILLIGGVGLFFTQSLRSENRFRAVIIIILGILAVWFAADNVLEILRGILPSITQGTDTVQVRYALWQSGLRMWLDYPVAGVGIGNFPENLRRYGWDLLPSRYLHSGAHNMYIAILAETGLIGLALYLGMFIFALKAVIDAAKSPNAEIAKLANIWWIVLILVMLAGITKHDHYDKFNWIALGISACIAKINAKTIEAENENTLRNWPVGGGRDRNPITRTGKTPESQKI